MLYPLILIPTYKDYIWGGRHILETFQRKGPTGKVAESWEFSDREEGMSRIENGPLSGMSLAELFQKEKKALMGKDAHLDRFPLLIKLIDAKQDLSIQVHPSDENADSVGGEAKTEAWHILDHARDAIVYAGFNHHYPKEEIVEKLPSEEILSLLKTLPVQQGDTIFIPGGRLHAIGAGCLLFEVQQNSNTTYRVYDWGRGRPLHIEEAKKVLLYEDAESPRTLPKVIDQTPYYTQTELIRSPYFILDKWEIKQSIPWPKKEDQCEMLFCTSGKNSLVPFGRSCLIPASCPPITLETEGTTLLRVTLP